METTSTKTIHAITVGLQVDAFQSAPKFLWYRRLRNVKSFIDVPGR